MQAASALLRWRRFPSPTPVQWFISPRTFPHLPHHFASSSTRHGQVPTRSRFTFRGFFYPLILLSLITSLTMNLRNLRIQRDGDERLLRSQISVLERLVEWLKSEEVKRESRAGIERRIQRELEMVGLGKREDSSGEADGSKQERLARTVSWKEVLLGRKDLTRPEDEKADVEVVADLERRLSSPSAGHDTPPESTTVR